MEKCKYCELGYPLAVGKTDDPNNDDYGITIYNRQYISAYGYDIHGSGSNGISVKINYCPMCGKRLEGFNSRT